MHSTSSYTHHLSVRKLHVERLERYDETHFALRSTMPREQAKIDELAKGVSAMFLTTSEHQPVTNHPALFCEYYAKGFVSGYRFSLFAIPRGLLQLLHPLAPEQRSLLAALFAQAHFRVKDPAPESGPTISQALYKLQALYKQYHALN